MARIGLNKVEVTEALPPEAKFWQCSWCHTAIPDGAFVCTGCHGVVRYKEQRRRTRIWVFGIIGVIIGAACAQFVGALVGVSIGIVLGMKMPLSSEPVVNRYQNYHGRH
jgi:predicted nucleic acid-binding Zn ribbon protein